MKSRQRKIEENIKCEKEGEKYYYFERGGGGAPIRDEFGRVIAKRGLLFENSIKKLQSGDFSRNEIKFKDVEDKLKEEWYKELIEQIEEKKSKYCLRRRKERGYDEGEKIEGRSKVG